ncbi:hypothetical protein H0E87_000405 [Populus deltoides]|uniref:Uncharacterized protein n=1 Tax=Populus deltoides TaxID=3696 RepID=A0A8T2ZMM3_POPDE|nr:hypothetical protein H0E87_000405 [Populus deltoides]
MLKYIFSPYAGTVCTSKALDSYKQKQEYHYSTGAHQESDAITSIYFAPLNAQAITHITPRKKFAMLTATLHIARPNHKPNCEVPGSACYDPCFIGGDGIVFYFHGKSNEQFSLVYDFDLQIDSRFIGHRPAGRPRDFTLIQTLGIIYNSQTFSLEAPKAATWDSEVDHLKLTYNGQDLVILEGSFSTWYSPEKDLKVERVSSKNSAIITLEDRANILVNVVPVTEEDDKIHKPDFENPAKPGVAMTVLGGEDKYRTTSLFSADCTSCIFSPESGSNQETSSVMQYGTLDRTKGASAGYDIVCGK